MMIMPKEMAKLCKKKVVVISVYVEKPTKRKVTSKSHRHHHHHHHCHYYNHQNIKQEVTANKYGDSINAGKGFSRRAQLLLYSQRLRESADHRPVESSHLDPIPKPISSNVMQPTENIAVVQRKPKYDNTPACLGKWKISKFKFCRSLTRVQIKNDKKTKHSGSTSNAVMNNLKVQKKRGFISKFLAVLQKRR
ncbi:uncharacterized protein LOC8283230 isoform X1 [Ricinus communis]|uniref:Uncharacterized protein n=1 Tax=Ricinus communis TaxID=3988 RepID=B9SEE2_RICCO|nr:uncharacterized protein LOC8283230 isoform X1 [Ricinus communis]EEF37972.1 conserved hypothetical protein [Ricinus communis]|eukprot:XP_002524361.1 uncharacterized protein LOC8283230 [Ricinus communis]